VAWGVADAAALDRVDEDARTEMAGVRAVAEAAPVPGPDSVFEDLFAPAPVS
jgi:TPP-dependent pyruvate/acetoin dehydrogenase alpha subunit